MSTTCTLRGICVLWLLLVFLTFLSLWSNTLSKATYRSEEFISADSSRGLRVGRGREAWAAGSRPGGRSRKLRSLILKHRYEWSKKWIGNNARLLISKPTPLTYLLQSYNHANLPKTNREKMLETFRCQRQWRTFVLQNHHTAVLYGLGDRVSNNPG